eukprot:569155-Amorphochlora_amoeboformis.AAC.1
MASARTPSISFVIIESKPNRILDSHLAAQTGYNFHLVANSQATQSSAVKVTRSSTGGGILGLFSTCWGANATSWGREVDFVCQDRFGIRGWRFKLGEAFQVGGSVSSWGKRFRLGSH